MDAHCRIRLATLADVPAIVEIERACFTDPWTAAGITETIQYETARTFIAQKSDREVGYAVARTSGEEGEILNLAVLPGHRRKGIGRLLLEAVLGSLASAGTREVYLEVRETNAAAIELYRRYGFRPVGQRPHYYRNPPEHALVFRASLEPLRQ